MGDPDSKQLYKNLFIMKKISFLEVNYGRKN